MNAACQLVMSADDVLRIPVKTFCAIKAVHQPSDTTASRVSAVLDSYACFSVTPDMTVPTHARHHHRGRGVGTAVKKYPAHNNAPAHGHGHGHGHGQVHAHAHGQAAHMHTRTDASWNAGRTRQPGVWMNADPVARTMLGALNKISERKYPVIKARLLSVLASGAVSANSICEAVLVKCYQEDGYLPLYTRLLQDLKRHAADNAALKPDGSAAAIQECLDAFVVSVANVDVTAAINGEHVGGGERGEHVGGGEQGEHVGGGERCEQGEHDGGGERGGGGDRRGGTGEPGGTTSAYDNFCAAAKRKRYAIGKNRTVIAFLRNMVVNQPQAHDYFAGLLTLLARNMHDNEHIELVIDFMTDYVRTFPQLTTANMKAMKELFDGHIVATCSPRSRFKIMDVYELCK